MLIRTKAKYYENEKYKGLIKITFRLHDIKRLESKKNDKKEYAVVIFDDNECVEVLIKYETLFGLWLSVTRGLYKEIVE